MAEFPDANSGGLDPAGACRTKLALGRRVRAWTIVGALYAILFGMAAAAIPLARSAFRPGVALEDRLLHLLWAGALLVPLGFVARYFLRVRLKTGLWRGTPEQRQQERQQRRAQCSVGGARKTSWTHFAIAWASYSAMDRSAPIAKRIAGWAALTIYAAGMLGMTALGVILAGAGFGTFGKGGAAIAAFGLVVLIWPSLAARSLIRGIRAGKVGSTREEVDRIRAQRRMLRQREWQKPLRSKLISMAVVVGVYILYWMRVTVHHAQHPHESWVTPAMATPVLIYSVWVQFRKPKSRIR